MEKREIHGIRRMYSGARNRRGITQLLRNQSTRKPTGNRGKRKLSGIMGDDPQQMAQGEEQEENAAEWPVGGKDDYPITGQEKDMETPIPAPPLMALHSAGIRSMCRAIWGKEDREM